MGFFTDTTLCIGCKACEVACKQWNELPVRRRRAAARATPTTTPAASARRPGGTCASSSSRAGRGERGARPRASVASRPRRRRAAGLDWLFMSDVCKHCTNAGCLDVCPTGAIIRTEFDTVVVQQDVCNGCGYCIPACPFGVIDRDPDDGRAAKCTLCYDRLKDGLEPACAKACPTDSIQFGPYDELRRGAERRVATLHERGVERRLPLRRRRRARRRVAGGLGAFFLLTEPPERYGLPAQADSPIQENVVPATMRRRGWRAGAAVRRGRPTARRRSSRWAAMARGERPERRRRRAAPADRQRPPSAAASWRRAGRRRRSRCTCGDVEGRALVVPLTATTRATRGAATPTRRRPRGGRRAGARGGELPAIVQGPMIKPPVWTWEVPLYFWFGGMAAGSSFVALACDLAGDERSARVARKVALGALGAVAGAADHRPRPARALLTCCGSSSRARRCRWARGA